jgi:hypothetical protein
VAIKNTSSGPSKKTRSIGYASSHDLLPRDSCVLPSGVAAGGPSRRLSLPPSLPPSPRSEPTPPSRIYWSLPLPVDPRAPVSFPSAPAESGGRGDPDGGGGGANQVNTDEGARVEGESLPNQVPGSSRRHASRCRQWFYSEAGTSRCAMFQPEHHLCGLSQAACPSPCCCQRR